MEELLIEKYKNHLEKSIEKAEKNESKLIDEIFLIEGMTGIKTKHFYNNLLELDESRLLEIGCYKGSSSCSFLYKNKSNMVFMDNFHDFLLNELHNKVDSKEPIQEFLQNIYKYKGYNNIDFFNEDCFKININKLGIFNIYLYDGDHSYESQYNALKYYINNMDDVFIFIVDDWNDEPVRRGTFDAIRDLNLKNVWNHEIRLTYDNKHTPPDIAHQTWWNGVYICILQKKTKLVFYDNIGYYTDDEGYIEGIPNGIAEPYPSDIGVVKKFIDKFANRCNTYIDIGAHIGTTCIPFSRIYNNVIGFEADYNNFRLLNKNIHFNNSNNITVNNLGIFNENCLCNIYQHKNNASGCFYLKKEENGKIICKSLDSYCLDNDVKDIDYIKIDTEGSELYVLEGSINTIKTYKPLISLEYNGLSEQLFDIKLSKIIEFFNNIEYVEFDKSINSQNLFFCHKDFVSYTV
jgi:hypothetical protein